tara:strand:+ start:2889 stop:4103 length:1215 start_codon:yes stop_codon:yes gene_type:complete
MAKKKKEEPIVDNEIGKIKVKEKKEKQPDGNKTKGNVTEVKEKMTMKPEVVGETVTKVNLNKPPKTEEEVKPETTDTTKEVITEKPVEEVVPEQVSEEVIEKPVVEEITNEEKIEKVADKLEQAIDVAEQTGTPLPEGIQKVVDFINETGGDLNDYVKLNQDYSEMDNQTVLEEYYRQTKPHLSAEERSFLMDDQFAYDEEENTEKEIKRKKLALKEQVASARAHLDEQKSKYYEEIKGGSKLTDEQREAVNFYNEAQQKAKFEEDVTNKFLNKTNRFFGDQFKGFEYNIGDKKFRVNISDAEKVKKSQSDINNFISKFVDKDYNMTDPDGYHKGLYTAMNPDQIANHFYEQGKADALKQSIEEAKNVNMNPRQTMDPANNSGVKVRVIGESANDFKFKIKNKN